MADLRSRSFIRIVDLLAEGEIEGLVNGKQSVYLNETPVENAAGQPNFPTVTVVEEKGTNFQAAINFIPGVENEINVNTELRKGPPGSIVRTITDPDVTNVRIKIRVPTLFQQADNGDVNGASVDIRISQSSNNGPFFTRIVDNIQGKATAGYERDYEIALSGPPPWQIEVTRLTDDSNNLRLQNRTIFQSYTEIIAQKFRYPNSAIVALRFDSESFAQTPRRSYDVKLLKVKVPSNYDPVNRTYSGIWDGTFSPTKQWTDNPAWCFYDLLTNPRYGLGGYLPEAQIDKWALYTISQYCDQLVPNGLGGFEPRFTCNIYIQSRQEAYKVVQDFASVFRGMVYWASGALTVTQDSPSDPVSIYNTANVVDGLFNYVGSASKARHTVALVSWNDPEDFYRQKVEYVEDTAAIARYGVVETEVTAVGCTSRGQANRVGRWLLYSEQNETEVVTFKTGLEGCVARPGNVIKVQDPTRAGARLGGRIQSATLTSITVDQDVEPIVGSSVLVMLPDGTVAERSVTSAMGRVVSFTPALPAIPQVGAVWVLNAPSVQLQTFRVVAMKELSDGEVEITALKHDPAKYGAVENGLKLPERDITVLELRPPPPMEVFAEESLYTYQAEVRAKISVGWDKVPGATSYRVEWVKDGVNPKIEETSANDFEILDITPGLFEIRVRSIGTTGLVSGPTSVVIMARGKLAPPSNVMNFTSVIDPSIGATLTWDPVPDLDLDVYEIRTGNNWDAGNRVAQIKGTSYKLETISEGRQDYIIKAIDTSGNESEMETLTTVVIEDANAPTVSGMFVGENLVLSWNPVAGTLATEFYEIRFGPTYANSVEVGMVKATTFSIKAQWSGPRTFYVTAVDIAGNYGDPGQFVATVVTPNAVMIGQEVIDNNVLLRWNAAVATLPVVEYEIRRGPTYAMSDLIGITSSQFSVIFETQGGTFTYWVTGIDAAGNYGTPASTTAQVSQPPDYELQFNQDSALNGTLFNLARVDPSRMDIIGPFDTTETWQSHFLSRGYNTIQAQINAGFEYYLQPSAMDGYYEEVIDYGTVLEATKITVTVGTTNLDGMPGVVQTISVRRLPTDPWIDYPGLSSVYVTNFRYVKIRVDVSSMGGDDTLIINGINVRFDVKLKSDSGDGIANAGDMGGTTVMFKTMFTDVQAITVTPRSTSPVIAVYDFQDVPNPTSFKVLLFNTAGQRVTAPFSWTARGV